MALIRWSRPELTVEDGLSARRRRLDRITWQQVLDTAATVEMELKRAHAELKMHQGGQLLGAVTVELTIDRDKVTLQGSSSEPGVEPLRPVVAHALSNARFAKSPTPMRVKLVCTFSSEADTGWDPFGNEPEGFTGGGRDDRAFGDPF